MFYLWSLGPSLRDTEGKCQGAVESWNSQPSPAGSVKIITGAESGYPSGQFYRWHYFCHVLIFHDEITYRWVAGRETRVGIYYLKRPSLS